jgi:hypothetical protein
MFVFHFRFGNCLSFREGGRCAMQDGGVKRKGYDVRFDRLNASEKRDMERQERGKAKGIENSKDEAKTSRKG